MTRRRALALARVMLAGLLIALVLWRVDAAAALAAAREAPAWVFVAPTVLLVANAALHAARVRLLAPAPRPGFGTFLYISLIGNFFGFFLPTGGGDGVKVLALARHVGGWDRALAVQGTTRMLELLPWTLLLLWGAAGVLPGRLPELVPLAWGAATIFALLLSVGLLELRYGAAWAARFPGTHAARLERIMVVGATPASIVASLVLTLPFALLNCAVVGIVVAGYGGRIPPSDLLGVIPTVDVLIALPVTVSGLGIREGLFVHSFAAWGIPAHVALAAAFTRWTGELGRAILGGVLFAVSHRSDPEAHLVRSHSTGGMDGRAEGADPRRG